ncbi:MFS transporter [Alcanivorax sp.]|jgi:MFS family permease|uniref:MFS transporter n=1 Tax=Alcanivorax sp. TaxID=1872427 RepID=UPI0032D8E37F
MNPQPVKYGFVAALGLGQMVSWGVLYYSFPLIAEAIVNDIGLDRSSLYAAATIGLLLAAAMAYPVGTLIDLGHGRKIMVGATIAASLTTLFWSHAATAPAFYTAIMVLGGLQAALLYEPAFAVVVRQLDTPQARPAITAITLWAGFSSTLFVPLIQSMLDTFEWRSTIMALAAINIAIAAPLYLWAIPPVTSASRITEPKTPTANEPSLLPILHQPRFYLLTASFCAYMALFSGFTYHIYPLLITLSDDTQSVVLAIALIGPAQVGARVLMLLFKKVTIGQLGLLTGITFPVAIVLLKAPPSTLTLIALCLLYGGANGIFTIVRGMAVPELLSRHHYGKINGVMLVPMSLARAAAPWAIAAYWTHTENPQGAINLILGLALLVPVLFAFAISTNRNRHTF